MGFAQARPNHMTPFCHTHQTRICSMVTGACISQAHGKTAPCCDVDLNLADSLVVHCGDVVSLLLESMLLNQLEEKQQ